MFNPLQWRARQPAAARANPVSRISRPWWQICLLAVLAMGIAPYVVAEVALDWSLWRWLIVGLLLLLLSINLLRREKVAGLAVSLCLLIVWTHMCLAAQQSAVFSDPTDVHMTVRVLSIPDKQAQRASAVVAVEKGRVCRFKRLPCRIRLSWYRGKSYDLPALAPGQRWRVTARLKPPWGYANPGGFDYAGWLKQQGIAATGYVRNPNTAVLDGSSVRGSLGRFRLAAIQRLQAMQPEHRSLGLLIGLAVGERSLIDDADRQVLVNTGTAHLLAISGMHIGMIASVGFVVGSLFWRLLARMVSARVPVLNRTRTATILALLLASGYALLAGFTLPTQRALLTLMCFSGLLLTARRVAFRHVLLIVLLLALLVDPMSPLAPGVWLSFGAVAALLWLGGGRLHPQQDHQLQTTGLTSLVLGNLRRVKEMVRVQLALSLLLVPMTVAWFGQLSLIAPLANLIAIPLVGALVLPALLVALLLAPLAPGIAMISLGIAGDVLHLMMSILSSLARLPLATVFMPETAPVALVAAILAALCLTKPAGGRVRWLALPICLPFIAGFLVIRTEGLWIHVLDVGQGQAVVIETGNYVLLYDTGVGSHEYSAFRRVIQPFFRARGIYAPDLVVISHSDNDHAGGLAHLREAYPDAPVMSPAAFEAQVQPDLECHAGNRWQRRGVVFSVLHPPSHSDSRQSDNNLSCVLLIRYGDASILIPGDIETEAEADLLRNWPVNAGTIDLLIAPHHGSASSSGDEFVGTIQPLHVVFSAGRWNRYKFPDAGVAMRYIEQGSSIYQTGLSGSIHFSFNRDGTVAEVRTHRRQ